MQTPKHPLTPSAERRAQKKKPHTEYSEDAGTGQPCDPGHGGAYYEVESHECTGDMNSYFPIDHYYDDATALGLASLDDVSAYTAFEPGSLECAREGMHPGDVVAAARAGDQDSRHGNYVHVLPLAFSLDDLPTTWTPSLQSRSSSTPHQLSGYQTPATTPSGVLPTMTPLMGSVEDDRSTSSQPQYRPANGTGTSQIIADHQLQQQQLHHDHHTHSSYDYDDYHEPATVTTAASQTAAAPLLHVATRSRNRRIMMTLLKHGVPPNERDELGRTALHVAASQGDESLVALLLRCGADPGICDVRGQTALYTAVEGGFSEVVELLLEKGASNPASHGDSAGSEAGNSW